MTMQKRTARDFCCKPQHGMIDRMSAEMPMTTLEIAMATSTAIGAEKKGSGRTWALAGATKQRHIIIGPSS